MIKSLKNHGKTVLLVTHALHVLPLVDYIYTIDQGAIVEEGTYSELVDRKGPFSSLVHEYGGAKTGEEDDMDVMDKEGNVITNTGGSSEGYAALAKKDKETALDKAASSLAAGSGKLEGRLIQQEKRNTGSIGRVVYAQYFRAGRGWVTLPLILASSLVMQGNMAIT